eukprot:6199776-Pleurochrysis_carterae.AAC.2
MASVTGGQMNRRIGHAHFRHVGLCLAGVCNARAKFGENRVGGRARGARSRRAYSSKRSAAMPRHSVRSCLGIRLIVCARRAASEPRAGWEDGRGEE